MNNTKKTKIVCTIGPATSSEEKLAELIKAGMNVVRLNFSHGDFAEHQAKVDNLKKVLKKNPEPIAVLQDLGGPKIRIGEFSTKTVFLKAGQKFTITTDSIVGDETRASVNYPLFAKEMKVGDPVLLDDGKKRLEVLQIKGNDVICKVIIGGETKGRRGLNLPGSDLSVSSITDKDRKDIAFGLKNKVDYFALSFVRRPEDIIELKNILIKAKSEARIIAKIETPQALQNIEEILKLTDAVMVARGDLAIEIPAEDVPLVQKSLIRRCNELGKPVITATQMLESMIKSPVPTRAEVSDVANAILDGTDAIMLSEETTLGEYPIEAVKMMTKIATKIEKDDHYRDLVGSRKYSDPIKRKSDALGNGAIEVAKEAGAKIIVALTDGGFAARMISRYKPEQKILALTPREMTKNQLALSYGCVPVLCKKFDEITHVVKEAKALVLKNKLALRGEKIVLIFGLPLGQSSGTNALVVETL
ncbi:MAG: pyruvate kinase [Candidatus Paceibacterota bacterium]